MAEGAGGERRNREAECAGIGEDCGAGEDEQVFLELRRTATEAIIRPRRGRGRRERRWQCFFRRYQRK